MATETYVSEEGDQPNAEIHNDIYIHLHPHVGWKSPRYLIGSSHDHDSHHCVHDISKATLKLVTVDKRDSNAYPGMIPMRELHPNRIPQQLHKLISRKYARLLTFVRIFPSCSDIPGGSALRLFLPFLEGRPFSLVAGTLSKYGSYTTVRCC